jgi:hypothetical protein
MSRTRRRSLAFDREAAEALALQGLTFIAEDPTRILRFLKLTGLSPDELRAQVGTPALSAAVLQYLADDESLLLVFAASRAIAPEAVGLAMSLLETAPP